MKRFYASAGTEPDGDGHRVVLDGKPVRTPNRAILRLPGARLATLVAGEWAAQVETVRPLTMPLTRLATTVVDLMPARRGDALAEMAEHARTDLLCYRAAEPATLRERQTRLWQPWLDHADRYWQAPLRVTYDMLPIDQPEASTRILADRVAVLDDWRLVAAHALVTGTGSLVLGLAVIDRMLDAAGAFAAATLDEQFSAERWGEDPEAAAKRERLRVDLEAAERFLVALGEDRGEG